MDNILTSKILPHSTELEEQILSGCLQKKDILEICLEMLTTEDFYVSKHQIIFKTMKDINSKNGNVDIVTVSEMILSSECDLINITYIAKLVDSIPLTINPEYECKKIKDYSVKRKFISKANEIQSLCFDNITSSDEIINAFQEGLLETGSAGMGKLIHIEESVNMVERHVQKLRRGEEINTGLSTGYKYLDKCLGKMQKSDLIILAARPSMGKTTLAMNIAANVARDENISVDVFSIEMSNQKLATRLVCSEGKVDSMVFKNGLLSDQDYDSLQTATEMVKTYPIYIDDSPVLTPGEMLRKARRGKKEHNTGLIVVDYLQFMKGDGQHARKDLEIGSISRAAKQMAKELDVPVIMLSQLNRSLETRNNKKPVMSDLRESGAIEQDADVIMFIYRDEVYNKDDNNPNKGMAEIIIAKNRDGITADVPMAFIGKHTRFESLEQNKNNHKFQYK